jgi:hypothetical protein
MDRHNQSQQNSHHIHRLDSKALICFEFKLVYGSSTLACVLPHQVYVQTVLWNCISLCLSFHEQELRNGSSNYTGLERGGLIVAAYVISSTTLLCSKG